VRFLVLLRSFLLPFASLELTRLRRLVRSEGFIVQQLSGRTYLASCRTDLLPADHPAEDDRLSAFSHTVGDAAADEGARPALGYAPHHAITTSFPCFASKLRHPQLVAASADGQQLHLWDLARRSVRTLDTPAFVDVSTDARVYYVEMDDECVYVAGQHAVLVVRPAGEGEEEQEQEHETRMWPPCAPPALSAHAASTWYAYGCDGVGWEAVHHAGAHLVAIGRRAGDEREEAKLVWTCDKRAVWSEGEGDDDEIERKTVVLVIVRPLSLCALEQEEARAS